MCLHNRLHVHPLLFLVVTGASEGIGRGYALEVQQHVYVHVALIKNGNSLETSGLAQYVNGFDKNKSKQLGGLK